MPVTYILAYGHWPGETRDFMSTPIGYNFPHKLCSCRCVQNNYSSVTFQVLILSFLFSSVLILYLYFLALESVFLVYLFFQDLCPQIFVDKAEICVNEIKRCRFLSHSIQSEKYYQNVFLSPRSKINEHWTEM